MFTDASAGWAIVFIQMKNWDKEKAVTEQNHELVVCRGGTFKQSETNWSVVEK